MLKSKLLLKFILLNLLFFSDLLASEENFLVVLVNARGLDYTSTKKLFKTLAKHPRDGSKNGDVGHAWIYLQGFLEGEMVYLEGGHSGERGIVQPTYMEGVFNKWERGDINPISYLWQPQKDGFFEEGSSYHYPTYAIKIPLDDKTFKRIYRFIALYPYQEYSIMTTQCCTFVSQIAAFAGVDLPCERCMEIDPVVEIAGQKIILYQDLKYQVFYFATPDVLEKSMQQAVREGKATDAMDWYRKTHSCKKRVTLKEVRLFFPRFWRYLSL